MNTTQNVSGMAYAIRNAVKCLDINPLDVMLIDDQIDAKIAALGDDFYLVGRFGELKMIAGSEDQIGEKYVRPAHESFLDYWGVKNSFQKLEDYLFKNPDVADGFPFILRISNGRAYFQRMIDARGLAASMELQDVERWENYISQNI